jgi:hypothetical protein
MNATQSLVTRQVSFFPPIGGGKYHATTALHGDEIAICRAMILDRSIAPIILTPISDYVSPMLCRRCLKITESER